MQNQYYCSHFLLICSALGHGRWCHASIKVFYCLNLHSRYTRRVFDNLSSKKKALVMHSINIYCLSTIGQAECSGVRINYSPLYSILLYLKKEENKNTRENFNKYGILRSIDVALSLKTKIHMLHNFTKLTSEQNKFPGGWPC